MKVLPFFMIAVSLVSNAYAAGCQKGVCTTNFGGVPQGKPGGWQDIQKVLEAETSLTKDHTNTSVNPVPIEDKGRIGHTFEIQEESLLEVIQKKLKALEASGRMEGLQKEIQQKTKERLKHPLPVAGITRATHNQKSFFDPTFTVERDIQDHKGRLIHKKGKKLNPLDHFGFGIPLLFIDGDDASQVRWAVGNKGKIVLTSGSPIDLSHQFKREIFFDQGGSLCRQLNITQVPTRVTQEGTRLLVESFNVGGPS